MICEICNIKEAGIHFQEIVNGNKMSLHLCHTCADKKDLKLDHFKQISISKIFEKFSFQHKIIEDSVSKISHLTCPFCKLTGQKFEQTGRFGCEHCYGLFRDVINVFLMSIHKGRIHTGKRVINIPDQSQSGSNENDSASDIDKLEHELSEAITHENFELAVEIRDQIKKIKK